jgi:hypothetical protein
MMMAEKRLKEAQHQQQKKFRSFSIVSGNGDPCPSWTRSPARSFSSVSRVSIGFTG